MYDVVVGGFTLCMGIYVLFIRKKPSVDANRPIKRYSQLLKYSAILILFFGAFQMAQGLGVI